VKKLRTGISWADWHRPERHRVVRPPDESAGAFRYHLLHSASRHRRAEKNEHYTSPPLVPEEFAWFAQDVVQRYVLNAPPAVVQPTA
jgi:hypothetical protein